MTRKIKISRHGLTRCPACQAHIQIAPALQETTCPFCQAALAAPPGQAQSALHGLIQGALATGRSGLLAASLLGLSVGAAACGDEEDPPEDTQSADSSSSGVDTEPQPAYGIPADTLDPTDTFDPGDAAMYGGPPDSSDTLDQPAYGIPADTLDPEDAADTTPEALYGGGPTDTTP